MKKAYDPQMHTTEHILNQTMIRLFGCERSFSNHIEKKKSKCDYHFKRPLEANELQQLQDMVNKTIAQDLPVEEFFLSIEEASLKFNLNRLPQTVGETIRIVRVGDYDACPCIGPHVKHTAEIGQFRIVSSSWDTGVLRIRFKLQRP